MLAPIMKYKERKEYTIYMAKKKIYAVRKGHKTGVFSTWAECQKATAGYSGAEFKSFTDKAEAMAFL